MLGQRGEKPSPGARSQRASGQDQNASAVVGAQDGQQLVQDHVGQFAVPLRSAGQNRQTHEDAPPGRRRSSAEYRGYSGRDQSIGHWPIGEDG